MNGFHRFDGDHPGRINMQTRPRIIATVVGFVATICWLLSPGTALGSDINDTLTIGGILAGAYQHQDVEGDQNTGRGAVSFQTEISLKPSKHEEIFASLGFGAGNGLNDITSFNLAPWAASLEDDVKDINGRNRDYLLTVWYKYAFELGGDNTLWATGGIIDATAYIDENAYANDEYTQFMNGALVNAPNGFAPSYDMGGAVEWETANWDVTAVGMSVGANDNVNAYYFFAGQLGYKLDTAIGAGNYRVIGQITDHQFSNEQGGHEKLMGAFISFDQELGDIFGAWIRLGWQDDKALVDYDTLYSGGINITGRWYGREDDNIGIGYAYLDGNSGIEYTQVTEVYWRFVLTNNFAVTADVQYMHDKYEHDVDDSIEGFILGVRGGVAF